MTKLRNVRRRQWDRYLRRIPGNSWSPPGALREHDRWIRRHNAWIRQYGESVRRFLVEGR